MNTKHPFTQLIVTLATCTLIFSTSLFSVAVEAANTDDLSAQAAIIIDGDSGKIFYEKNSEQPLPIASMTKVLTLYLILEAISEGTIAWEDQIEISDHLLKISHDLSLSNIMFIEGRTYSVRDLFNASTLISANAAITALAETVAGGSEADFVDLMRAKVTSWGINDAYLISTSGINNEDARGRTYPGSGAKEENLMSAKSMAIVARHLINDFPEILDLTSQPSVTFSPGTDEEVELYSSNLMLPGYAFYLEGVDGLKTGTTELAGTAFAGTILKDDQRLISVVMHSDPFDEDQGNRFVDTAWLMNYVFDNWTYGSLTEMGKEIESLPKLDVKRGKKETVTVVSDQTINTWLPNNLALKDIKTTLALTTKKIDKNQHVKAPVHESETLATLNLTLTDQLGYLTDATDTYHVGIIANEEIEKANLFVTSGRAIKAFFNQLFS
ncbi:serine hydrolase [Vagococcus salmoninarum]|uniref:serine hydrolase n=1 Tax=Vagococcus salmoninarum TaxID=2739 RepID=UPI0018824DC4|nr:serine hydrolase [Vagococcus salmoninarum]MBE9389901.1 D-alanyl-D-alanine carboxypeptidase [Vagococcus salmoninarum]